VKFVIGDLYGNLSINSKCSSSRSFFGEDLSTFYCYRRHWITI